MTLGEILVRLRADATGFDPVINRAIGSLGRLQGAANAAAGGFSKGFAALTLIGLLAGKNAAEFEMAFARVKKTVDRTSTDLVKLRGNILELSKTIPIAATELAKMTAIGGQMGITGTENLTKFTDTVARLSVTADMAGDQAATMLGRIAQVNNIPMSQFDQLGDSLVFVADKSTASAAEILRTTMQMQGMGHTAGLTAIEMFGFSAALINSGMRVEAGGTAFARFAANMSKAVATGGPKLEMMAKTANLAAKDFQKLFGESPAKAMLAFFEGLSTKGSGAFKILDQIGMRGVRSHAAILGITSAMRAMVEAQENAAKGFGSSNALQEKSNELFNTAIGQWGTFKGKVTEVSIAFGTHLLPAFKLLIQTMGVAVMAVSGWMTIFDQLPSAVGAVIAPIALTFAGLAAFGKLVPLLAAVRVQFALLQLSALAYGGIMPMIAGGISAIAASVSLLALSVTAVIGTLAGLLYILHEVWDAQGKLGNSEGAARNDTWISARQGRNAIAPGAGGRGVMSGKGKNGEKTDWRDVGKGQVGTAPPPEVDADTLRKYNDALAETSGRLKQIFADSISTWAGQAQGIREATAAKLRSIEADEKMSDSQKAALKGAELQIQAAQLEALAIQQRTEEREKEQAEYSADLQKRQAIFDQLGPSAVDLEKKFFDLNAAMSMRGADVSTDVLTNYITKIAELKDQGLVSAATMEVLKDKLLALNQANARIAASQPGSLIEKPEGIPLEKTPQEMHDLYAEIQEDFERVNEKSTDWKGTLGALNSQMQALGISSDSTLGKVLGGLVAAFEGSQRLGDGIKAFGEGFRAADAFSDMYESLGLEGLSAVEKISAGLKSIDWADMVQGIGQVIGAFMKATDSASAFSRILGGAMVGAKVGGQIGAMVGGEFGKAWGQAIGAVVGGVAGLLRGKPDWAKAGDEIGKLMGVRISDELAKEILKRSKDLGISIANAGLLALPKIIDESGKGVGNFSTQIRALMEATASGAVAIPDGFKSIGEAWDMAEKEAKDLGQTFSSTMLQMVVDARAMGLQIPAIMAHVAKSLDSAAAGLEKVFSKTTTHSRKKFAKNPDGTDMMETGEDGKSRRVVASEKHWTEQEGGLQIKTENSARAQALIFGVTFAAVLREKGLVAAVEMFQGTFATLKETLGAAGFQAVFDSVLGGIGSLFGFMENDLFKGAAEAAAGLAQTMRGLAEAGYLGVDAFHAFGTSAIDAFNQAFEASGSEQAGILATLPLLAELKRAHDLYGYQLSAEEQALMDLAVANSAAFPTDPILQIRDAIYELIEAITGIPRDVQINVNTNHTTSGGQGSGGGPDGKRPPPDEFAASGFFNESMPWGPGAGGMTTIGVHPGERVSVTPSGENGSGMSGSSINLSLNPVINVNGARDPKATSEEIVYALKNNLGGIVSDAKRALGIAG